MGKKEEKPVNGYVVYCHRHLQDGHEEWAKCFDTLEQVIAYCNRDYFTNGYENITLRVYELGKEIPLQQKETKEPQPPKVKKKYEVKE